MKDMTARAVSREEISNSVYPLARRELAKHGIRCDGHAALQVTMEDYRYFGRIYYMDRSNAWSLAPAGSGRGCPLVRRGFYPDLERYSGRLHQNYGGICMNRELLEEKLANLPLYIYDFIDPRELDFSDRIRWICEHECPMYGKSWACPPGVGSVSACREKCLSYKNCLMISTIAEVSDIADINETLATRPEHEKVTNQVRDLMRQLGAKPYVLSTEACTICSRCAYLDGLPCRMPGAMHPCVESQGINVIPLLEKFGLEFQYGENVVTWVSLLFFA